MRYYDTAIKEMLDSTFNQGLKFPNNPYTLDQLRMAIVATNLKGLVNAILMADEKPDEVRMDFKQLALGILGTIDFLTETLPSLEPEIERTFNDGTNYSD